MSEEITELLDESSKLYIHNEIRNALEQYKNLQLKPIILHSFHKGFNAAFSLFMNKIDLEHLRDSSTDEDFIDELNSIITELKVPVTLFDFNATESEDVE